MKTHEFENKVAVITGSASGIGAAIALEFAQGGAHTVIIDIDEHAAKAKVEDFRNLGFRAQYFVGSILEKSFLHQLTAALIAQHGHIDILVNNAGIIRDNYLPKISEQDWDDVLAVNLKGPFLCCQAVTPHMRERGYGKVVNIISRSWLGNVGQANYSASKGGLVSLTRTLALELAAFKINVNAVSPGLIDTPMTRGLSSEVREKLIKLIPTKEIGQPEDIASAVAFLAGDRAKFITGQVLHVDGGKSCGILSL